MAISLPKFLLGLTVNGGPSYDPDALALFAAMTTPPDLKHKTAINALIVGLKTAGLWSQIDFMCGWAARQDEQAAVINWINPTQVGVPVNSPTFTPDVGFAFNGVDNYVNTQWVLSTQGVALTAISALLGTFELTNVGTSTVSAGVRNSATNRFTFQPRLGAGTARGSTMSTLTTSVATTADSTGFSVINRLSGIFTFYKDGSLLDTVLPIDTTGVLPTISVFWGAENNGGVIGTPRASTQAGLILAAGLTAGQQATLSTLLHTAITATS